MHGDVAQGGIMITKVLHLISMLRLNSISETRFITVLPVNIKNNES